MDFDILPYQSNHRNEVLQLTIDAWTLVFAKMRLEVPGFVYGAFYPDA